MKAVARALRELPRFNASYVEGRIETYSRVNVGIAVATDDALLVPVVLDADRKSLAEIAADSRRLADSARQRALTPDELHHATFTVSNLGMHGVGEMFAIINPPQACILGVGAAEPKPVVEDGKVVAGTVMTLSISADHRVLGAVDHAHAALAEQIGDLVVPHLLADHRPILQERNGDGDRGEHHSDGQALGRDRARPLAERLA